MASSAQCRGVPFVQANGRAPCRLLMAGSGQVRSVRIHTCTHTHAAGPETLNQGRAVRSAWPWPLDAYGRQLALTWNGLPTLGRAGFCVPAPRFR
jgi:hypothetical protein